MSIIVLTIPFWISKNDYVIPIPNFAISTVNLPMFRVDIFLLFTCHEISMFYNFKTWVYSIGSFLQKQTHTLSGHLWKKQTPQCVCTDNIMRLWYGTNCNMNNFNTYLYTIQQLITFKDVLILCVLVMEDISIV